MDIVVAEPPLPLGAFRLNAFVPRAALADAGLQWLLRALAFAGGLGRVA